MEWFGIVLGGSLFLCAYVEYLWLLKANDCSEFSSLCGLQLCYMCF